jgi:uncharacterized protein YebE (UPF0316 family)
MELDGALLALAIFALRVLNYTVGTIRLILIGRGHRLAAASLAALEALIFAVVIAGIVQDLENALNLTAYCLGAAVGSWVGMELERRLITSFVIANVFTGDQGHALAERLRDAGFGVTESNGLGRDGVVITLRSVLNKRQVSAFNRVVNETAPNTFVVLEEAHSIRHGYLGIGRGKSL